MKYHFITFVYYSHTLSKRISLKPKDRFLKHYKNECIFDGQSVLFKCKQYFQNPCYHTDTSVYNYIFISIYHFHDKLFVNRSLIHKGKNVSNSLYPRNRSRHIVNLLRWANTMSSIYFNEVDVIMKDSKEVIMRGKYHWGIPRLRHPCLSNDGKLSRGLHIYKPFGFSGGRCVQL